LEQSYKFRDIETNMNQILSALLKNNNFKKYIYYSSDNPLTEPDVSDSDMILGKRIVPAPVSMKILDVSRITMFFNYRKCSFRNQALSSIIFIADLVIPIPLWSINSGDGQRWIRITDEIAKELDQQLVTGIGEVSVGEPMPFPVNDEFAGISIPIIVQGTTLKGVR